MTTDEKLQQMTEWRNAWRELALARDKLLECYAFGRQPPGAKIRRLRRAHERVVELRA